jgi:hypothetical protein
MTNHAIQRTTDQTIVPTEWAILKEQAQLFIESGLLPQHIKTPAAAILIMLKGRELGIPPLHALNNIAVIGGKPVANAELMLALIYRDHGDDAIHFTETTPQQCTISYARRAWAQRDTFTFSMDDARRAALSGTNWTKYPAAMLRARCISAVARLAFPDSIGGMYSPEEMGAAVEVNPETGEILTVESTAVEIPQESRVQSPVTTASVASQGVSAPQGGNQGPTATAQQDARVTRDQLATLKGLVGAVGMSDDGKIAYLHKYHATQFSQLTADEATACIADLQQEADRVQQPVAS